MIDKAAFEAWLASAAAGAVLEYHIGPHLGEAPKGLAAAAYAAMIARKVILNMRRLPSGEFAYFARRASKKAPAVLFPQPLEPVLGPNSVGPQNERDFKNMHRMREDGRAKKAATAERARRAIEDYQAGRGNMTECGTRHGATWNQMQAYAKANEIKLTTGRQRKAA